MKAYIVREETIRSIRIEANSQEEAEQLAADIDPIEWHQECKARDIEEEQ